MIGWYLSWNPDAGISKLVNLYKTILYSDLQRLSTCEEKTAYHRNYEKPLKYVISTNSLSEKDLVHLFKMRWYVRKKHRRLYIDTLCFTWWKTNIYYKLFMYTIIHAANWIFSCVQVCLYIILNIHTTYIQLKEKRRFVYTLVVIPRSFNINGIIGLS